MDTKNISDVCASFVFYNGLKLEEMAEMVSGSACEHKKEGESRDNVKKQEVRQELNKMICL